MGRTLTIACGVALAAILLTGCRYDATYTINADNTVSGRIYVAGYLDPADPGSHSVVKDYVDADADSIADNFTGAVNSLYIDGDWYGRFIDFEDQPLSTFAAAPSATWDIQIVKDGDVYRVNGYLATEETPPRNSARDNGGYLRLDVRMRGTLVQAISAVSVTESPARVQFDLLNGVPVGTTPYAISNNAPPPPDPPDPPDPDPIVTVVITPDPDPVVTPAETPSATPSASPSAAPVSNGGGESIPAWVWAVGGVLIAALAGMIGFALANRKAPVPAEPVAKAKPKKKAPEESEEELDDEEPDDEEPEGEEPEDEQPEDEAPKKRPSPKK